MQTIASDRPSRAHHPGWTFWLLDNVNVAVVSSVPEPSSIALLGAGLFLLAHRRKAKG
jgi:PEP-CTERM motif